MQTAAQATQSFSFWICLKKPHLACWDTAKNNGGLGIRKANPGGGLEKRGDERC